MDRRSIKRCIDGRCKQIKAHLWKLTGIDRVLFYQIQKKYADREKEITITLLKQHLLPTPSQEAKCLNKGWADEQNNRKEDNANEIYEHVKH
jgi:hypothetical protein